jgi:hypothetical protein
MTEGSRRGLSAIPKLWILPLGVLAGILYAVIDGVLSSALLLDLVAWWPVWAVLGLLVWLTGGRRLGPVKLPGLVPLLAFGALVTFLAGHLQGWTVMPSATGTLVGPEVGEVETVALSARIDGTLELSGGGSFVYVVAPIRWGGEVGLAQGFEEVSGTTMRVSLRPDPDSGLQAFRGWEVTLADEPAWDLELSGSVQADLTRLMVSGLDLGGEGTVALGGVTRATTVNVAGVFTILIPGDQAARVIGEADVPEDWVPEGDSWRAPVDGEGWVIEVSPGGQVVVQGS